MNGVYLEDVRCFKGAQEIPLTPLTFLVGENSTGKSSFLAMMRLAWDCAQSKTETVDFDEVPFRLGTYDRIAHYHGGQGKRSQQFGIGFTLTISKDTTPEFMWPQVASLDGEQLRFRAYFSEHLGQPRLTNRVVSAKGYKLALTTPAPDEYPQITIETPKTNSTITGDDYKNTGLPLEFLRGPFPASLVSYLLGRSEGSNVSDDVKTLEAVVDLVRYRLGSRRPHALSPIRSEPLVTYEPGTDRPTASGQHAPQAISRIWRSNDTQGIAARSALMWYGRTSGLFESLEVKPLGARKDSDPFQVRVQIAGQGRETNLVDVGYGVSQVLPILVDSFVVPASWYLLQQPEVHLHPKAQAELGTFFAKQTSQEQHFIVETHSDYIVDRVCMEIREGRLPAWKVTILFFRRWRGGVRVDRISVDDLGNLVDTPSEYRAFFLNEQRRALGG